MQSTQHPIVAGVDESHGARTALDWAADDAELRGQPLRVVCVYHGSAEAEQLAERLVSDALAHLDANHPGVVREGTAVEGDAVHVLLEESKGARLVAVGPRHRTGLGSSVLGSVSGAVATRSGSPVVVMCGPAGMREEGAAVVAGVDGTEASQEVLAFAFEHAAVLARRCVRCCAGNRICSQRCRGARSHRLRRASIPGWPRASSDYARSIRTSACTQRSCANIRSRGW